MRILNLEPEHYSYDARRILDTLGDVVDGPFTRAELKGRIEDIDVLIVRLGHSINHEILQKAKKLKVIVSATTGLNHIDVETAEKNNIAVLSLKGEREFLNTIHATAEHTVCLMLSLLRRIPAAHHSVTQGYWARDSFRGEELEGKTLGILGLGRLGAKVSRYAHAFGMRVICYDIEPIKEGNGVTFISCPKELARQSDIISIHIPSSPENHHFVDSTFISNMKFGARLINTSRGDVLDQKALLIALDNKKLSGAALDVLEEEYTGGLEISPLIEYAKAHDNLIITPHIGGATWESMHKTEVFMASKLEQYLVGAL